MTHPAALERVCGGRRVTMPARVRAVFDNGTGDGLRTVRRQAEAEATAHLVARARGADLRIVGREPEGRAMAVDPGASPVKAGPPHRVVPPGIDGLGAARRRRRPPFSSRPAAPDGSDQ